MPWDRFEASAPEWRSELIAGRDAIARSDANGHFRLALPPGPATLRVYGPTPDFIETSTRLLGNSNITLYSHAHAKVPIEVPATGFMYPITITLTPGLSIHARLLSPAPDSTAGLVLALGRVLPVRGYAAIPLTIRTGTFTVPGARANTLTRLYILDPVACVGATIDATSAEPLTVALAPCDGLRLRLLGPDHEPLPQVRVNLYLLMERDPTVELNYPQECLENEHFDPQPVEWFDAINYPTRPKTNADGIVGRPALIPGARYSLTIGSAAHRIALGPFTIVSGKTQILPDFIVTDPHTFRPGASR